MKSFYSLFALWFISFSLMSQVGINNSSPDSKSVLDLKSKTKGLLIPRLTSIQREALSGGSGFAQGMMVYDTDLDILFIGYGSPNNSTKWYAMNPWKTEYRTYNNASSADMTTMTSGKAKHGNLGIGTLTPTKKLTISGNDYQFGIKNTTRKDIWGLTNWGNNLYFQYTPNGSSASNKMILTSSGDLGIGTISPNYSLDVNGSARLSGGSVYLCQSLNNSAGNVGIGFGGHSNVKLAIKSNQTYALTVDGAAKISGGHLQLCQSLNNSAGNVGIGAGAASNAKLHISSNQTIALHIVAGTGRGVYVKSGTNAQPGGGSWLAVSDARLKEGVVSYSDGLNELLQIKPVKFHYTKESGIGSGKEYVGVIAQDMAKIAPYMVEQAPIPGLDGEYYNLDNSAMTYMLINAVKEQQEQIKALKNEVEALKNK
ncbi:MAG: tail fiber domain-containing protein [Salibacteraceae bacterium]|nr:tail fiber domain-containing protein [Salibacteraceae bacterium]